MNRNSVSIFSTTAAVLLAAHATWAAPTVGNVEMSQRDNSRIVDITYTLSDEDAVITLDIETNGVALPDSAVRTLLGDVSKVVQQGTDTKHIVWNAGEDWPEHLTETAKARVTAWSVSAPPLYMVVDLGGGYTTNAYPVYYYASAEAVPGGLTNYLYKTYRLALRRLSPTGSEGFLMGSPTSESYRDSTREDRHNVVLTNGFYIGIYEVTQSQWQQVMGDIRSWPSAFTEATYKLTRPVEMVSYYDIRESTNNADNAAVDWPNNRNVFGNSFMGRFRTKTGFTDFDLPTEAQWEYACRAGTTGSLNDGTVVLTNENSDAHLDVLGRYKYNGGYTDSGAYPSTSSGSNGTATVGSYLPNAWGLYDMHGNLFEWCLDYYQAHLGEGNVIDPLGLLTGSTRAVRGGAWTHAASGCRSVYRAGVDASNRVNNYGFRVALRLP